MKFLTLLTVLALFAAKTSAHIYLPDGRTLDESLVPVGTYSNKAGFCTTSLIDSNIAITAAHCIVGLSGDVKAGPHEVSIHGEKAIVLDAVLGTKQTWKEKGKDWALLRLDKNLGDELGYFKVINKLNLVDDRGFNLTLKSFQNDLPFHLFTQEGCKIRYQVLGHNLLFHDCDTAPGSSGAPMLKCQDGNCILVGIHTVAINPENGENLVLPEFDLKFPNGGINPNAFYPTLLKFKVSEIESIQL